MQIYEKCKRLQKQKQIMTKSPIKMYQLTKEQKKKKTNR